MMKKKVIVIMIVAMVMTGSLTACQKTGDTVDNTTEAPHQGTTVQDTVVQEIPQQEMTLQEATQLENNASLEILTDSPEYQACAEWWDFSAGYDTDFAILEQVDDEALEAENAYEAYNCYSPEMEKKVDEICEKYSLSKLGGLQIVEDYSELCSKTGIGDFCERKSENVEQTILSSYLYDGAFMMEGAAAFAGSSTDGVSYQFSRVVKGYFTSAYLDFGDLTGCGVREYTTGKGEKVFFAIISNDDRGTNAYIIAEREKSFIVVNVRGEMSDVMDVMDERLEHLADAFDFAAIP